MNRLALALASLLALAPSETCAQDDDTGRSISAAWAGMSFGLGALAVSLPLADGDEGWMGAAIGGSVSGAVAFAALAYVAQESSDPLAVMLPTLLGGLATVMTFLFAMTGTMEEEEWFGGTGLALLLGPVLGTVVAAVDSAMRERERPSFAALREAAPEVRVVLPVRVEF